MGGHTKLASELTAAGSRPRPQTIATPAIWRRIRLLSEIAVFYVGAPLMVTFVVYGLRLPLFLVLPPVLLAVIAFLLWDRSFDIRRELARDVSLLTVIAILATFCVIGGLIAGYVASEMPRQFLSMPRNRPRVWITILVLYPVLSVAAQELVYRTFFFHRYGPLFGERRWLAILVNGALFATAHIMFYNPVAFLSTFLGGCLFAWRYTATRSFWAVCLEHTLYGWLIFTIGLGGYFFTGIANPMLR